MTLMPLIPAIPSRPKPPAQSKPPPRPKLSSRPKLPLLLFLLAVLAIHTPLLGERELRLEEIFSETGLTRPAPTHFQWSPDGRRLTFILPQEARAKRDLWEVDPETGAKRVLVSQRRLGRLAPGAQEAASDEREKERLLRYNVAAYHWSPDSKSILFASSGRLYLYHLSSQRVRPIAPEKQNIRDPKFSPNGRWISFIHGHDIWLAPASGGAERRLTSGATADLLHGDLDWIYPEEFGLREGYRWSPDSKRVAFLEFDQSAVPSHPILSLSSIQPSLAMQRYPRPGDPNPRVRLGIIEARPGAKNQRIVWVQGRAEYTPRFGWVSDEQVYVQRLNRAQNHLRLEFADAVDGRARVVHAERDPYWINITNDLRFLRASDEFLWTSERSGFRHIELYSFDGKRKRELTAGEWEVKSIRGVDEVQGWVYYTSNEDNPLGADLYRIGLDGSRKQRLTTAAGTHAVSMNSANTAYYDRFSARQIPPRWEAHSLASGRRTLIHETSGLEEFRLVKPEPVTWITPDQALVRGMLLKPPSLEPGKKYPLLVYVYGGPRVPTIRDAWQPSRGRYFFHQYLARKGYVIAYVDDRTSSRLGHRYETAARFNYGPVAVRDYVFAVEQLGKLDFVDPERIAIWGWSGGGFSTCFALTHTKQFKLGIAVAPVTDWRLYDSIYTERYMGDPRKQAEAYRRTSAVEAAANLYGRLLLVHPTADDNVHLRNTLNMVSALIQAGKPYDLLLYPGKTHSIDGQKTRLHLYQSIERYLDENL